MEGAGGPVEKRQPAGKPRREQAEAPTARRGEAEGGGRVKISRSAGRVPPGAWEAGAAEAAAAAARAEGVVITGDCSSPETSGAGPGGARELPGHLGRPARGAGPRPAWGPRGRSRDHVRKTSRGVKGHGQRLPAFPARTRTSAATPAIAPAEEQDFNKPDCPPWEAAKSRGRDTATSCIENRTPSLLPSRCTEAEGYCIRIYGTSCRPHIHSPSLLVVGRTFWW
ncbi:unnamed protein product [Rangifer tarandus platyrhynchus]|uniref:Uncharacterized protein n=1 Tax=Rangifer tarandus platyrhynchus TaxID=3082113 RepID=A0ABN8YEF7_RANTA|nr:unnamed protein product [Rangifer tarandus platyrhynchus]